MALYWRCTSATQQWFFKKYYLFIIFFTFWDLGTCGSLLQFHISPRHVSVTDFNNVRFRCLVEERPSDCSNNELLQWHFNNSWRSLKSGEKYEIQERKTKTRKRVSTITIFNISYADEGTYSCSWICKDGISTVTYSSMKVVSGMNNCVIISSAFSKDVRVGEILRYKEEGGKKINAEKM